VSLVAKKKHFNAARLLGESSGEEKGECEEEFHCGKLRGLGKVNPVEAVEEVEEVEVSCGQLKGLKKKRLNYLNLFNSFNASRYFNPFNSFNPVLNIKVIRQIFNRAAFHG
jgi:hypothetical protein